MTREEAESIVAASIVGANFPAHKLADAMLMMEVEECDHEGHVVKGQCEKCGETGLESDAEIYELEAPR